MSNNSTLFDLSTSPIEITGSGAGDDPSSLSVPTHNVAHQDPSVTIIKVPTNVEPYGFRMQRSTGDLPVSTFHNSYLHKIAKHLNIALDNRFVAVGPEFHCCNSYGKVDLALAVSPYEGAQVRDPFPVWLHESKPANTKAGDGFSRVVCDDCKRSKMGEQLMQRLHNKVFRRELETYGQRYLIGSSGCGNLVALWLYSITSRITYRIVPDPDGDIVKEVLKRTEIENVTYSSAFWNYDAFRLADEMEKAFTFAAKEILAGLMKLKNCPPDDSFNVEHHESDDEEGSDAESEDAKGISLT